MTGRQKFLRLFYPVTNTAAKLFNVNNNVLKNLTSATAPYSFYELSITLNTGEVISTENLRGKKILIVNTASDCGYTPQYKALQTLSGLYSNTLIVIGFPANDFKEQEKGTDEQIAAFCQLNFGITFLLAKKSTVIKGNGQNGVFKWLSHKADNGWNDLEPSWNFCKYLVNENGMLTHYFEAAVSPLDKEVIRAIEKATF